MNNWSLYPALILLGLSFCDDLAGFRRLMSEQAGTRKAVRVTTFTLPSGREGRIPNVGDMFGEEAA